MLRPTANQWKDNRETTSFAGVAFDRDGSLMRINNVLDQRQAETTALDIMDQPVSHPVKLLENPCLFSAWNSNTVIGDFNRKIRPKYCRGDRKLLHIA